MKCRCCLTFLLFMLFCVSAGFADTDYEKGDFWICPSVEASLYSDSPASFGGGFALGYGKGTSIGMKTVWFLNPIEGSVLEFNFLLRYYFSGKQAYSGPFIQFIGGPVLFFDEENGISVPSKRGNFSIGMSFGWRFLIKDKWFIEPYIRGGHPYLVGTGLSAGIRF